MRYDATIKYNDKQVTIKVPNKVFAREYELTEFLKMVRELHNISYKEVHLATDWGTDDCEAFEKGEKPIPKEYLESFAEGFKLPKKLKYLGYVKEKELRKTFSARLADVRIQKDIPQLFVALELNIARSTYACYETGKNTPDLETLVKLADYFDVSIDYLTGRDKYVK